VAAAFIALGVLAGHFGVDGFAEYLAGSREAPSDPLAVTVALTAALWLLPTGVRLLIGCKGQALLSPLGLVLGGLASIAGGLWMMALDLSQAPLLLGFGGFGLLALRVGLKRWHAQHAPAEDAA
jgi:hypothetical protein